MPSTFETGRDPSVQHGCDDEAGAVLIALSESSVAAWLTERLHRRNIRVARFDADRPAMPGGVQIVFVDYGNLDAIEEIGAGPTTDRPAALAVAVGSAEEIDRSLAHGSALIDDMLQWPASDAALDLLLRRCGNQRRLAAEKRLVEENLRDLERESNLIADNIPAGITYIDSNRQYRFVNKLGAQWLGLPADDIIGRDIAGVMGPAVYGSLKEAVDKALRGEVQRFTERNTFPDGVTRDVDRSFVPDFDDAGNVRGFFVLVIDTTERNWAEAMLAQSEQRLREAVESFPGGFILYDSDGALVMWNRRYCELYPWIVDLLVPGAHLEDIAREAFQRGAVTGAADNLEEWLRIRLHTLLHGEPSTYEQHLEDGRWLLCQDTKTGSGYTVCIRTEITAVKLNEERLKQATELAKIGNWVWSTAEGKYLHVSEELARIHGESVEGFLHQVAVSDGVFNYIHRDDRETYRKARRALRKGEPLDLEYRIFTRGGDQRHVREIARPVYEESGTIVRETGTVQDITEMKLAEEQLLQAQKMEVVGQITGGVAHDFNNLLGIIIGNLDLLEEGLRGNDALHALTLSATDAALRGAQLTRHLLAFARQQPLRPDTANVNILIEGMDEDLRRTVGDGVAVDYALSPELWPIRIDATQLESALLHLAVNAGQAMPQAGGSLLLSTDNVTLDSGDAQTGPETLPFGRYVSIQVKDTGHGMPSEVRDRAIDPFFTTKQGGDSSGLGLSMVDGFAKQSGGKVDISSAPGKGTTVTILLPAAQKAASDYPVGGQLQ